MATRKAPPPDKTLPEETESSSWVPVPGATLTGTVTSIQRVESEFGDYPMLTLKTDAGNMIDVHAFHSILRKELVKAKPNVGDRVAITYLGQKTSRKAAADGKKRSYHAYTVTDPDNPPEPFTWASEDAPF